MGWVSLDKKAMKPRVLARHDNLAQHRSAMTGHLQNLHSGTAAMIGSRRGLRMITISLEFWKRLCSGSIMMVKSGHGDPSAGLKHCRDFVQMLDWRFHRYDNHFASADCLESFDGGFECCWRGHAAFSRSYS